MVSMCSQEELEPNNHFQNASKFEIELDGGESYMYGFLTPKYYNEEDIQSSDQNNAVNRLHPGWNPDVDFYELDFTNLNEELPLLELTISNVKSFDVRLSLYNKEEGDPIKVADDYWKNFGEALLNIHIIPGIYYLKVDYGELDYRIGRSPDAQSNEYSIKAILKPEFNEEYEAQVEKEPNDQPENACPIDIDHSMLGYYSPFVASRADNPVVPVADPELIELGRYDEDWYQFRSLNEGKSDISITISDMENVNAVLFLFDKNLNKLITTDYMGFNYGEHIANFTINGRQDYYICVVGINNLPVSDNIKFYYLLNVKYITQQGNFESENNDSRNNYNLITGTGISGKLSPYTDVDYYRIPLTNLQQMAAVEEEGNLEQWYNLVLTLSELPEVDLQLILENSEGNLSKVYNDFGMEQEEKVCNFATNLQHDIFVKVSGAPGNVRENVANNYTISFSLSPLDDNMEREVFTTMEREEAINYATPLDLGRNMYGFMAPSRDVDYFSFPVRQFSDYLLSVRSVPGVEMVVEVWEEDGTTAVAPSSFYIPDEEPYYTEVEFQVVSPARHFVVVIKDKYGRGVNYNQRYYLKVEEL